jgi:hypothetical protein
MSKRERKKKTLILSLCNNLDDIRPAFIYCRVEKIEGSLSCVLLFLFPSAPRALALWPKNTVGGNYYRKIKTPELGVGDHSSVGQCEEVCALALPLSGCSDSSHYTHFCPAKGFFFLLVTLLLQCC